MEDKIDRLLRGQAEISTSIAVLEARLNAKGKRIEKNEKEIKDLNKFKWGIIGTAAVSISTFIKSMFT
jgi:hypothetical protein